MNCLEKEFKGKKMMFVINRNNKNLIVDYLIKNLILNVLNVNNYATYIPKYLKI